MTGLCACWIEELYICVRPSRCPSYTFAVHLFFQVLERRVKYFTLDFHGKWDTVSVDHLKPAFLGVDFGLHDKTIAPAPDRPSKTTPCLPPP